MKLRIYDPRILAIDLRHRRFGFAVFEGHRNLVGWGARLYPATGEPEVAMMSERLTALLKLYSPSAIVTTQERWDRALISGHICSLEEEILRLAAIHSIAIHAIRQAQVRQSFQNLGCETRFQTAASLTRIFPELLPRLPLARRLWDSEHSSMTIFDAVALGLAYWQHENVNVFEPDDPNA
jgi:hypothetical protein